MQRLQESAAVPLKQLRLTVSCMQPFNTSSGLRLFQYIFCQPLPYFNIINNV